MRQASTVPCAMRKRCFVPVYRSRITSRFSLRRWEIIPFVVCNRLTSSHHIYPESNSNKTGLLTNLWAQLSLTRHAYCRMAEDNVGWTSLSKLIVTRIEQITGGSSATRMRLKLSRLYQGCLPWVLCSSPTTLNEHKILFKTSEFPRGRGTCQITTGKN
jgi:hypothetical protein